MLNRKLFLLILLAGIIVLNGSAEGQQQTKGQEWKNITIFHTTRLEVEKQFGKPSFIENQGKDKFVQLYKTEHYNLVVHYARGCKNNGKSDYSIQPDSVIYLIIYLRKARPVSEFNIDEKKFEKTTFPPNNFFDSVDEGLTYELSGDGKSVISITYRPKKEQYELACRLRLIM